MTAGLSWCILSELGTCAIYHGFQGLLPGRTFWREEDHCLWDSTNVLLPHSLDLHPVIICHPLGPLRSGHRKRKIIIIWPQQSMSNQETIFPMGKDGVEAGRALGDVGCRLCCTVGETGLSLTPSLHPQHLAGGRVTQEMLDQSWAWPHLHLSQLWALQHALSWLGLHFPVFVTLCLRRMDLMMWRSSSFTFRVSPWTVLAWESVL